MMRRAIFLDRDGVLSDLVYYPSSAEYEGARTVADLKMMPGVAPALRRAADAGWLLFIVSNQPSYTKGKTTLEDLRAVQEEIIAALAREGARVDESFLCFHHPQGLVEGYCGPCECRKPSPHFLLSAADKYGVALRESWMIGDQDTDLLCGRNAGCRVGLVEHPLSANKRGRVEPDLRAPDLPECIEMILQ